MLHSTFRNTSSFYSFRRFVNNNNNDDDNNRICIAQVCRMTSEALVRHPVVFLSLTLLKS